MVQRGVLSNQTHARCCDQLNPVLVERLHQCIQFIGVPTQAGEVIRDQRGDIRLTEALL